MDENRSKSTVLFLMMGVAFVGTLIYAFVIGPNMRSETLGSSNLVLEIPVQKRDLRYAENGVIPFCLDDNDALTFEIIENASVTSSSQGVVSEIINNLIIIEAMPNIYIEYEPLINITVNVGDYVSKDTVLGSTMKNYFNLRLKNTRSDIYECPYIYLNNFGKTIVDESAEVVGYEGNICECVLLKY
jgi:hypothetical protein